MTSIWQRFATSALFVSLAMLAACRSDHVSEHGPRIVFTRPELNAPKLGLDMEGGPFASYDAVVIAKIRQRWLDLLSQTKAKPQSGKVVVECRQSSAGEMMDVKITSTEVSEPLASLCRKAVVDPVPSSPWPDDMRRAIGKDYRSVALTFNFQ